MAFTAGFSVNVGDPTKASDVDVLAANDDYLKNAIDTFIANDANNRVLTATGSGTANAETNLTFDGSTLTVTGTVTATTFSGNVTGGTISGTTGTFSGLIYGNGGAEIGSSTAKTKFYSDATYNGIYNGSSLGSNESYYFGAGSHYWYSSGAEAMRLYQGDLAVDGDTLYIDASADRVGVNNASPSQALDVAGDVIIDNGTTSTLYFDTNTNWMQLISGYFRLGLNSKELARFTQSNGSGGLTLKSNAGNDLISMGPEGSGGFEEKLLLRGYNSGTISFQIGHSVPNYINTGQNFGIGTSSPADSASFSRALDVNGPSGAAVYVRTNGSASNYGYIGHYGTTAYFVNASAGPMAFYTNGSERLRITSTGAIEIPNQNAINELTFTGTDYTNIFSNTTGGMQLGTTGAGSYLALYAANAEAIHIDSSQRVGIGTSSPPTYHQFTVVGTYISGFYRNVTSGDRGYALDLGAQTSGGSNVAGARVAGTLQNGDTNGYLYFETLGGGSRLERARITSDGKLCINRTSGNAALNIDPVSTGDPNIQLYNKTNDAYTYLKNDGSAFVIQNSYGTTAGYKPIQFMASGSADMTIESNGDILVNGATSYIQFGAGNNVLTDNDAVAIYGGGFIWSCRQGNVAYFSRAASTGSLVVFKYDKFTDVGSVSVTSTSTAYNTSSDYRLKENLAPITGAVDRVNALQPRRFNFISDPDTTVDGFVAHEVSDIVPEAITGEKDAVDADGNPEYQGIDQSKLVPLLTAAIQELTLTTQQLTARIEALEAA